MVHLFGRWYFEVVAIGFVWALAHHLLAGIRHPVDAIFAAQEVPTDQLHFSALNVEPADGRRTIARTKAALPDADA